MFESHTSFTSLASRAKQIHGLMIEIQAMGSYRVPLMYQAQERMQKVVGLMCSLVLGTEATGEDWPSVMVTHIHTVSPAAEKA